MALEDKKHSLETLWVIGGSSLYQEVMESSGLCHRIYMTKILKQFQCDTFLPQIDLDKYKEVTDESVNSAEQEEDGIKYVYKVYERFS